MKAVIYSISVCQSTGFSYFYVLASLNYGAAS